MIPRDEEFDVFVTEGALVEVWRGAHVSVAQQFGVDWDGPTHSAMHAAVFCPAAVPIPPMLNARVRRIRVRRLLSRRRKRALAWLVAAALCAAWLASLVLRWR